MHEQLVSIGTARGDDVEHTGTTAGKVARCMKGDSRSVLNASGADVTEPPFVAVEIGDRRDQELSFSNIETMRQNREAHVAMVVAAHPGSLPRQYRNRHFVVSRPRRFVGVVVDPDSQDASLLLSIAYDVSASMTYEVVRRSGGGDWNEVARKVEAVEEAVQHIGEARLALAQIERKAHDAGSSADKRNAYLLRTVAELAAVVRAR